MKKTLFVLTAFILISGIRAQVIFCPPGAEWHYGFWGPNKNIYSESIRYVRDSTFGSESFKVLAHDKFYLSCNDGSVPLTLIKQKGDTIFFRNAKTQHSWQILYNFATPVGWSWQTSVLNYTNVPVNYTQTVDSATYVFINGKLLKRISVNNSIGIVERLGNSTFLFNFMNAKPGCAADNYLKNLCYKDNEFGVDFTIFGCPVLNPVGIEGYRTEDNLLFYPNPVKDKLYFEPVNTLLGDLKYRIVNALGQEMVNSKLKVENSKAEVAVSFLAPGIYYLLLQLKQSAGEQKAFKIIKE